MITCLTLPLVVILTQNCEAREEIEGEARGNKEREEGGERGEGSGDGAADDPPSRTTTNDSHLQALTKQETNANVRGQTLHCYTAEVQLHVPTA